MHQSRSEIKFFIFFYTGACNIQIRMGKVEQVFLNNQFQSESHHGNRKPVIF
jgi:hypothetical protein